ncbi:MAG: hypothetical protein AB1640_18065 [bacterium]
MGKGRKVEIPGLGWFDRYKRLIDLGYRSILEGDEYVYHRWGEEEWLKYVSDTRPKWTEPVARRIVEKRGLKPTVEDGLQLWGIYSQEVWGYGDPRYVDARMESEGRGILTALGGCRMWALRPAEKRGKVPCHKACRNEMQGVANALSPKFKVDVPRACPLGDSSCEFVLTAEE